MTDWRNALQWVVDAGADEVFGPETRYWVYGTSILPRDEYHQAIILVPGAYSPGMLAKMPQVLEQRAKDAGFRLLKVRLVGGQRDFEGSPAYMFVGYAASDVWEKSVQDLGAALFGAPVVIDSDPVGPVEAGTLDGLWIAKDALPGTLPEVRTSIKVNPWPLIGAGVAITAVVGLMIATLSLRGNRRKA